MRKLTVGVTGGTGFIGSYLLRDYAKDYEFVALTSRDRIRNSIPGVRYVKTDYTERSFSEAFAGCDAVIHLGAKVPDTVYGIGSIGDYIEGMQSTERLLRAVGKIGIKNVIFTSSVAVYSKINAPIAEDMPYEPNNAYGISKVTDELLISAYAKKYGYSYKILRVAQVLGYRLWKKKCFFSMLQDNAYNGEPITVYGSGEATRDIVYVRDVANAINCSLQNPGISGIYNVGMGKGTSNLELAEAYSKIFPGNAPVELKPFNGEEDTQYWFLDISKAKQDLGYAPRYDISSMVRDIREEYSSVLKKARS